MRPQPRSGSARRRLRRIRETDVASGSVQLDLSGVDAILALIALRAGPNTVEVTASGPAGTSRAWVRFDVVVP
jgi:hypothetical protein